MTISYEGSSDQPATLEVFWRDSGGSGFGPARRATFVLHPGLRERTLTVRVLDRIDQFRIDPDNKPRVFSLLGTTLLVEAAPAREGLPPAPGPAR